MATHPWEFARVNRRSSKHAPKNFFISGLNPAAKIAIRMEIINSIVAFS
jgi:hypothetical protein